MKTHNKSHRVLDILSKLGKGHSVYKIELAEKYNVSEKTIQRDIDDIRAFYAESGEGEEVVYDKKSNAYRLASDKFRWLTPEEIMAVSKILLESRSLPKQEMYVLIDKLLALGTVESKKVIAEIISNEKYHYIPIKNAEPLLSKIWEIAQYIKKCEIIEFEYIRQDKKKVKRLVKPVSIVFSEFYFYLIAYFVKTDKEFPAVFRIDRMREVQGTKENFLIPYRNRFEDGEFRKRVQFMYPGELMKVKFKFWGSSLDAVLDRLPTAKVVGYDKEKAIVEAEVFGKGIAMWLRSQGEFVEVMEPEELKGEV